ncbi:MAG: hypothetical protein ACLQU3_10505 [Limisphaerales bacterium]
MNRLLTVFLALTWCLPLHAAQTDYARRVAPLIDPAKLATLGKRGANQRVQKAVYWLAEAREAGARSRTRSWTPPWALQASRTSLRRR